MATVTVDTDDLVTVADIAHLTSTGRTTVSMWIRRAETTGFPAPAIVTATRSARLWSWAAVRDWLAEE